MNARKGILVLFAIALVGAAIPPAEASVYPWACAVANNSCTFYCPAGTWLAVTASVGLVTLTCDGITIGCVGPCYATGGPVGSGGVATCTGGIGRCTISPAEIKDPEPEPCPPEWTHVYGSTGSGEGNSATLEFGATAGVVTVSDSNEADCDGNGVPGDFDGDYDIGVGGGFFGLGPYADDPTCQFGLNVHGPNVVVSDVVVSNVAFVTAADDQDGPTVVTDPDTGDTLFCTTDGSITPDTDADDCISDADGDPNNGATPYVNVGTACGAGGDGGFWVFLLASVQENGGASASAPTAGTITAS